VIKRVYELRWFQSVYGLGGQEIGNSIPDSGNRVSFLHSISPALLIFHKLQRPLVKSRNVNYIVLQIVFSWERIPWILVELEKVRREILSPSSVLYPEDRSSRFIRNASSFHCIHNVMSLSTMFYIYIFIYSFIYIITTSGLTRHQNGYCANRCPCCELE